MADNGGGTIGGVTFNSLGLLLIKSNIPLLPETRQVEEEIPGMHGSLDMDTVFGPRQIELTFKLVKETEGDYQIALQNIAKAFNPLKGTQELILDRMTGKRWLVKYNGTIPIEKFAAMGEFTVPLKAFYPFSESVIDSLTPPKLGDGLTLGMGYELSQTKNSFSITSSSTIVNIQHFGNMDVRPIIRFTGSCSSLTVTNDTTSQGFSINLTLAAGDILEVDCAKYTVKRNGVNVYSSFSGDFTKLVEGDNAFTISAVSPNMTVDFIFRHTYLY